MRQHIPSPFFSRTVYYTAYRQVYAMEAQPVLRCCPGWSQQPGDQGCLSGECPPPVPPADTRPASEEPVSWGCPPPPFLLLVGRSQQCPGPRLPPVCSLSKTVNAGEELGRPAPMLASGAGTIGRGSLSRVGASVRYRHAHILPSGPTLFQEGRAGHEALASALYAEWSRCLPTPAPPLLYPHP